MEVYDILGDQTTEMKPLLSSRAPLKEHRMLTLTSTGRQSCTLQSRFLNSLSDTHAATSLRH